MEINQEESSFPGIKFGNKYVREESPNQNLKDLDNSWNLNCESGDSHICTDGKVEKVSEDIVDLLPNDPFGMVTTFTTGWIDDFDLKDLGFDSGEDEDENVDDQLVAKVNIVLNSANGFHTDMGNNGAYDDDFDLKDLGFESGEDEDENVDDQLVAKVNIVLNSANGFHTDMGNNGAYDDDFDLKDLGFESGEDEDENVDDQLVAKVNIVLNSANGFHTDMGNNGAYDDDFDLKDLGFESGEDEDENVDDQLLAKVDIVLNSANGFYTDMGNNGTFDGRVLLNASSEGFNYGQEYTKNDAVSVGGPPPDALFFSLTCGFLGVKDLLAVERVCKSLQDAVQSDPLLWRNFHIDYPLSHKLTDDALLLLANRAHGQLQSLSLIDCIKITDHGLKKVLESNPGLTKLNVSGSTKLSVEGIIDNLRFLKLVGTPGIKYLRIGGFWGITTQQFEEFKFLLGIQNQKQQQITRKPRFIREGQLSLSFDDEREIDIEICPRCQHVRQVYDCTADGCKGKLHTMQACRACILCIFRCRNCGRCLINCDYEETFGFELICLDCCKEILSRQEVQTTMTILLYG